MFAGIFDAQFTNRFHDNNLEFITNFTHKRRDLFHQTVDGAFVARLQQCGDRQGGDGTVGVRYEAFHVVVAFRYTGRVDWVG